MFYGEGGYRPPQNKEAAFHAGRATFDSRQLEMQLRSLLSQERERRGEGFNEAEFVREQLVSERDLWRSRQRAGEGGALGRAIALRTLIENLDAAAYDRYTSVDVQNSALVNIAGLENRQNISLTANLGSPEWFGVIAGALDLPYTHRQTIIQTSPAALAELSELGVEDGRSYTIPVTLLAQARKMNELERKQSHDVFTKTR